MQIVHGITSLVRGKHSGGVGTATRGCYACSMQYAVCNMQWEDPSAWMIGPLAVEKDC